MSRRWQVRNTDKNEKTIVKTLRQINGLTVQTNHDDILVGFEGKNYWFEIKNPKKVKKDGAPVKDVSTPTYAKQQKLLAEWQGHYSIVSTLDEILDELGI